MHSVSCRMIVSYHMFISVLLFLECTWPVFLRYACKSDYVVLLYMPDIVAYLWSTLSQLLCDCDTCYLEKHAVVDVSD